MCAGWDEMTEATGRSSSFASRLREDVAFALEHTVFTSILGSPFLPRFVRRTLLLTAGADARSSVGTGFALAGSARNLSIGSGVFLNKDVSVEAIAPVTIGANTSIGMQVLIITSHHEIADDGQWDPAPIGKPVTIGERVWIGARATILPGARIDDDVIIAAGAVVTGHLTSHGIYGGVPARRIRDLPAAV